MTNFEANILVLGGTGESGRRILCWLSQRFPKLRLGCAARRQPAHDLPARTCYEPFDLNNTDAALGTLRRYKLAIIALGPMEKLAARAHQLCLDADIDAIDINDNFQAACDILQLHGSASRQQRLLLTGMGFAPGISTLMLTTLARQQASSQGCYRSRLYMGAAYGGGETSPYAILASFRPQLPSWNHGRVEQIDTPWQDGHNSFRFPAQAKSLPLIPYATPEVAGLASPHCAPDLGIQQFDSRYHIQYLSQGFARLMSRFRFSEARLQAFAAKFFRSGQQMKLKKDADPDTCVWVYPDDQPAQGLVLHGVVSSYDLTARMACAAAELWLKGHTGSLSGVYAVEHLSAQHCQLLTDILVSYGVSFKAADATSLSRADIGFGWVSSSEQEIRFLRNYRKNWYTASPAHPKMAALQKQFLLSSDIWRALTLRHQGMKIVGFVAKVMWRWKKDYQQLHDFRQQAATHPAIWQRITKDISMFTSGYRSARDTLGPSQAFQQYRQMFLDTGKMEMRWLWPNPEAFRCFPQPNQALLQYWLAFMQCYAELGLFELEVQLQQPGKLACKVTQCSYAAMFSKLGCTELSDLVREMEQEALHFLCEALGVQLIWVKLSHGEAMITLACEQQELPAVSAIQRITAVA